MAGINEAYQLKAMQDDYGKVLAKGTLRDKSMTNYIIMEVYSEDENMNFGELQTIFDYGGDVRFGKNIKVGTKIKLHILDEYSAEWRKAK